jgi:hypothetical protein
MESYGHAQNFPLDRTDFTGLKMDKPEENTQLLYNRYMYVFYVLYSLIAEATKSDSNDFS